MSEAIDAANARLKAEQLKESEANRTLSSIFEEQRQLQTQADVLQSETETFGPSGVDRQTQADVNNLLAPTLSDKQKAVVDPLRFYLLGVANGETELDETTLGRMIDKVWNQGLRTEGLEGAAAGPGASRGTALSFAIGSLYFGANEGEKSLADLVFDATGQRLLAPQPLITAGSVSDDPWWGPQAAGLFASPGALQGDTVGPGSPFGGGFGGGGGGGGRVYQRPDENEVRDFIRGKLKLLVGGADEGRVELLLRTYMREHRVNFDRGAAKSGTIQVSNPVQAVVEQIRTFGDYAKIHKLCPEDIDEEQWLTSGIGFARQQPGVTAQEATDRGIAAATSGDVTAAQDVFATQERRQIPQFFQRASQTAAAIGRSLR